MKQKYVYVVFSATNLKMGKFIRFMTRSKYNHVSVSLNENINPMYTFARIRWKEAYVGGFIEESPMRYKYKLNKDAIVKLCKIPVDDESYNELTQTLDYFSENRDKYLYNTFSAIASLIHKKVKLRDAYTCIEFVSSLPGIRDILPDKSNEFISVSEFEKYLEKYSVFEGDVFDIAELNGWGDDVYIEDRTPIQCVEETTEYITTLIKRKYRG